MDKWNYIDQIHIWFGFFNSILQISTFRSMSEEKFRLNKYADKKINSHFESEEDYPLEDFKTMTLILVSVIILIKTFFYLRIISGMSYIVTMVRKVLCDLTTFMSFYFILILMFSSILSILKIGNYEVTNDPELRKIRENPLGYPN